MTNIRILAHGQEYKLVFRKNDELSDKIRGLEFRRWNSEQEPWGWVMPAPSLLELMRGLKGSAKYSWEFDTENLQMLFLKQAKAITETAKKDEAKRIAGESKSKEILEVKESLLAQENYDYPFEKHLKAGINLFRHQKMATLYLQKAGGGLLAAEMGLGKGLIFTLAAEMMPHVKKVLIICPNSLKFTLREEVHKFLHSRAYILNHKAAKQDKPEDCKFFIVNYEYFSEAKFDPAVKLKPFGIDKPDLIVCDESHRLKETKSNTYKNIKKLFGTKKSKAKFIMSTGTPIKSYSRELFTQLHLIDPLEFPTKGGFEKDFCGVSYNYHTRRKEYNPKREKLAELYEKIKPYMLRILKSEATDLPEKLYSRVVIELSDAERREYQRIESGVITEIIDGEANESAVNMNAMTKMLRLREYLSGVKAKYINEAIQQQIQDGHKVVFIDFFKSTLNYMHGENPNSGLHTGDEKDMEIRNKIRTDFQDPTSKMKLFLGSSSTCKEGLTLTASNHLYLNTLEWTVADCDQIYDRCIAKGQEVVTKRGFVKIENVLVDDIVLSHTGNWRRVTDTSSKLERKKAFVEISYKGFHKPLICTTDHKIYVFNASTASFEWVDAGKLDLINHQMLFPKTDFPLEGVNLITFDKKHRNKTKKGVVLPDNIVVTTVIAEALGHFLAEGTSNGVLASVTGHIKEEVEVINYTRTLANALGINHTGTYKRKNFITCTIHSQQFARQVKEWFYDDDKNKVIPDFVFSMDENNLRAFIKGYFFGDGYRRNSTQQATIASHVVASQLIQLLVRLGETPTLRTSITTGLYSLEFSLDSLVRRKKLIENKLGYLMAPIQEIRMFRPSRGKERVYDLTVEVDHSFIVGNAAVHNCHRIGQVNTCYIYLPVVADTVDELVYEALETKRVTFNKLIDNREYISMVNHDVFQDVLTKLKQKHQNTNN